jgi:hypothetical protein
MQLQHHVMMVVMMMMMYSAQCSLEDLFASRPVGICAAVIFMGCCAVTAKRDHIGCLRCIAVSSRFFRLHKRDHIGRLQCIAVGSRPRNPAQKEDLTVIRASRGIRAVPLGSSTQVSSGKVPLR